MNVLLVDDDKIFNMLSSKTLQRIGHVKEVHTAINGKEAIDLINEYFQGSSTLPDIIQLDLNMPIMDGFEFIHAFQRLNIAGKENVKIIIVTSSQDPKDLDRAKSLGITQYLTKPISEKTLWNAINNDT